MTNKLVIFELKSTVQNSGTELSLFVKLIIDTPVGETAFAVKLPTVNSTYIHSIVLRDIKNLGTSQSLGTYGCIIDSKNSVTVETLVNYLNHFGIISNYKISTAKNYNLHHIVIPDTKLYKDNEFRVIPPIGEKTENFVIYGDQYNRAIEVYCGFGSNMLGKTMIDNTAYISPKDPEYLKMQKESIDINKKGKAVRMLHYKAPVQEDVIELSSNPFD